MFQKADPCRNVSIRVSEVLDEIGVNENMVSKRRRMYLLRESMSTVTSKVLNEDLSWYHFGSQTEGSTTESLRSDEDSLVCNHLYNVIQDLSQWEEGKINLLIHQNDSVTPGYCFLEILSNSQPGPADFDAEYAQFGHFMKMNKTGGALVMNSIVNEGMSAKRHREGPSLARAETEGFVDEDSVSGRPCKEWPEAGRHWTDVKGAGEWPTKEIQIAAEKSGCFVVAVGGKGNENEVAEWRLSTSLAERVLMFSLNITQIRCYILMKMILKTFIHPRFGKVLTSFMCKTILFHSVRNLETDCWREWNILPCLIYCLQTLWHCLNSKTCQHFTIPENNLMRGKLSQEVQCSLMTVIHDLLANDGRFLTQISFDNFGFRLRTKLTPLRHQISFNIVAEHISVQSSEYLILNTAGVLSRSCALILAKSRQENQGDLLTLSKLLNSLNSFYMSTQCTAFQKAGSDLISHFLFSMFGSTRASIDIGNNKQLSVQALDWLAAGEKCDATSGKLKIASVLYTSGDVNGTLATLLNIEEQIDIDIIEPMCACYDYPTLDIKPGFKIICHALNEEAFQIATAFCVRFLPSEYHCIPKELQYEIYRSTTEDEHDRDGYFDFWMDWAVVDSLPMLYFLQYKTYQQLGARDSKDLAMAMLAMTIVTEKNLGHRETALNLLGQCLEQEKSYKEAMYCFLRSLKTRKTNNAAKIHICTLLMTLKRVTEK